MNTLLDSGLKLASDTLVKLKDSNIGRTKVLFLVPFTHLSDICSIIGASDSFACGAQNCHQEEEGAYTGEISASMVASAGGRYVILGHSERRQYAGEDNALLAKKIRAASEAGLSIIYCVGETLDERENGEHKKIVETQLKEALEDQSDLDNESLIIAYEPVWAIGTGKTASPDQAEEMHKHIRNVVASILSNEVAESCSILYGGSMKPENAEELLSQPNIDGGLIGGAALDSEKFVNIVSAVPSAA